MRDAFRKSVYRARVDRWLFLLMGLAAISAGVANFFGWWSWTPTRILSAVLAEMGLFMTAFVIQSGRNGYLAYRNYELLQEIRSSQRLQTVEGHRQIHEAEIEIVKQSQREIRILTCATDQHSNHPSKEWSSFWKLLASRLRIVPDIHCRVVGAVGTVEAGRKIHGALGGLGNPVLTTLQSAPLVSCVIGDTGAVLAFSLGGVDRGLGLVIEDAAIAKDLRIWFDCHVASAQQQQVA